MIEHRTHPGHDLMLVIEDCLRCGRKLEQEALEEGVPIDVAVEAFPPVRLLQQYRNADAQ